MLCFVSAMDVELQFLLQNATILSNEKLGFGDVKRISIKGKECYVCRAGIGKVLSSTSVACCLLKHPEITGVINIGIGGSLDAKKAPLMTAVLGVDFVQHDLDTSALGNPIGYLHGLDRITIESDKSLNARLKEACGACGVPVCEISMSSGDRFLAKDEDKAELVKRFGVVSVDMESAAMAEACFVHEKPFACLRIISDAVDHEHEYWQYRGPAAELACKVAMAML